MSIRILHTADLHLGSRMSSLGQAAPDFQEALIQSFDRLLQEAEKRSIDLFLIAGDFLEVAEIQDRELNRVHDLLVRERSFPVLIAAGNHDPYSSASPYAALFSKIPRLYVFPSEAIVRLDFPELDTSVWGVSFGSLYQETTLLPDIGTEQATLRYDGSGFPVNDQKEEPLTNKIGLVHGELIAGSSAAGVYNSLPSQRIRENRLDYLALGHIHKASELPQGDRIDSRNTMALYPGSPQGLSFNEAGARQALIVELDNSEILSVSSLPSSSRMFIDLNTEINSSQSDQEIIDQIVAEVREIDPVDYRRHSYKIHLRGEAPSDLKVKRLESGLREEIGHVNLLDELRPAENIKELGEEQTLRGLFVRKMLAAAEESDNEDTEYDLQQALRLGLAAFRGEAIDDVY
ncbi:MAG TPA: hypothetical protein GXZ59_02055 [Clostridiaceae bacterium]|nr:hypothetical protein [Clostridiaceae bacterium]